MRDANRDGFMGRANDREAVTTVPDLISLGGSIAGPDRQTSRRR